MNWTPGDVSGSQVLTAEDHIYETHINELRAALITALSSKKEFTVGPVGSNADYIVDGTADDVQLQAAHDALGGLYGRIYVLPGTYNVNAKIAISKSNIEIELAPGAIIKAAVSLYTGFQDEARGIFQLCKSSAGSTQQNVYIHGGTIDCNSQVDTQALAVWGSGNDLSIVATSNILVEKVAFINHGNSSQAFASVIIRSVTNLTLGRVKNVWIYNCNFNGSDNEGVRIYGTYHDTIKITDCEFQNIAVRSINYSAALDGNVETIYNRTSKNFYIERNYFHNTMTVLRGFTVYDFGNIDRTGIIGLYIRDNVFDGSGEYKANDNPHILVNSSYEVFITGNVFRDTRQALNFGYSNAGDSWFVDPPASILVADNQFIRVHATLIDYDATIRTIWRNNMFYKCGMDAGGGYSSHEFTVYEGNIFYDMNNDVEDAVTLALYNPTFTPGGLSGHQLAAVAAMGQYSFIFRGNYFIDDRLLQDPLSTPSADASTIAGGSLTSRTYFYRYAYGNKSGITKPSPSQSVAIGANSLLKIVPTHDPSNIIQSSGLTGVPLIGRSGIETIYVYVGTSAGAETLQATIGYSDASKQGVGWTEPTSGLVSGTALSSVNTTHALSTYGIFENTSGGNYLGPNIYQDNYFFGISLPNCIYSNGGTSSWVRLGNVSLQPTSPNPMLIDDLYFKLSSVLGVGSGGTGSNSVLNKGSLVFAGAGGAYAGDDTGIFWDAVNKRLGVGSAIGGSGFNQVVAQTGTNSTVTSLNVPITANTTAGNTIIGAVKTGGGALVTSVTDSKGNTWSIDKSSAASGPVVAIIRCNLQVALTTSDTVTVNFGSNNNINVELCEYVGAYNTLDESAANNSGASATTAVLSGGTPITHLIELVVAAVGTGGSVNQTSISLSASTPSLTVRSQGPGGNNVSAIADGLSASLITPSSSWAWTTSATWGAVLQTYVLQSILPTAELDLGGSTTARAATRIRTGVAPSNPNDGDIWYDGTNLKMRVGGTTKIFTLV